MSQQLTYLAGYPTYHRLWRKYAARTMISRKAFIGNLFLADYHRRRSGLDHGSFVECGTWRGGMAFALVELCGGIAECHFFDSYEGLPPAGPLDGDKALGEQAAGQLWHDNNTAALEDFLGGLDPLRRAGRRLEAHKGWFTDTLPGFAPERPIALLRLDGDWYDSTLCILDNLFDRVMPGGLILIDDYYDWDGCSRAVHDFLSARKATERIRQSRYGGVAYMLKEATANHDSSSAADRFVRNPAQ